MNAFTVHCLLRRSWASNSMIWHTASIDSTNLETSTTWSAHMNHSEWRLLLHVTKLASDLIRKSCPISNMGQTIMSVRCKLKAKYLSKAKSLKYQRRCEAIQLPYAQQIPMANIHYF